jgi:hypothetical protein
MMIVSKYKDFSITKKLHHCSGIKRRGMGVNFSKYIPYPLFPGAKFTSHLLVTRALKYSSRLLNPAARPSL